MKYSLLLDIFCAVECWVILHLNLNRSNKVHREFCLKSNLKTISALTVFAFHLVGNNTWIIFLVEGENISAGGGGLPMAKIFGNFIKTTFAPLASAFDPICCWYHLDYLSTALWGCNLTTWKCHFKPMAGYDVYKICHGLYLKSGGGTQNLLKLSSSINKPNLSNGSYVVFFLLVKLVPTFINVLWMWWWGR